jgi:hypothetical protein
MRIKPNQTLIEGTVRRIVRALDGIGADVEIEVSKNLAADPTQDFVRAQPGQTMLVFAAVPEEMEEGHCYRLATSMLGGPGGTRVVVQSARKLKPSP